MIETLTAAGGEPILRVDGKLMASRFDPRAEARAWVDARSAFITRVRTIFVLGLGSGYHVAELLALTTARIVVIEPRADVIEASALDLATDRVSIACLNTIEDVRANAAVLDGVKHSYVTMVHPPSRALDPQFYRAVVEVLNGRQWGSLNWIWSVKGHADLGDVKDDGREDPLTIYDLAQTELVQNSSERERLLIKALRELVK